MFISMSIHISETLIKTKKGIILKVCNNTLMCPMHLIHI